MTTVVCLHAATVANGKCVPAATVTGYRKCRPRIVTVVEASRATTTNVIVVVVELHLIFHLYYYTARRSPQRRRSALRVLLGHPRCLGRGIYKRPKKVWAVRFYCISPELYLLRTWVYRRRSTHVLPYLNATVRSTRTSSHQRDGLGFLLADKLENSGGRGIKEGGEDTCSPLLNNSWMKNEWIITKNNDDDEKRKKKKNHHHFQWQPAVT